MTEKIMLIIFLILLIACTPQKETTPTNDISQGCGVSNVQGQDCYIDEGGLRHCNIEPNYL